MAKQKRTNITPELEVYILQHYADCGCATETARVFDIASNTVYNVRNRNMKLYEEMCEGAQDRARANAEIYKRTVLPKMEGVMNQILEVASQRAQGAIGVGANLEKMISDVLKDEKLTGEQKVESIKSLTRIVNVPIRDLTAQFETLFNKHELAVGKPTEIKKTEVSEPEGVRSDERRKFDKWLKDNPKAREAVKTLYRTAPTDGSDQGVPEEPSES